jgi:hypothetical protein
MAVNNFFSKWPDPGDGFGQKDSKRLALSKAIFQLSRVRVYLVRGITTTNINPLRKDRSPKALGRHCHQAIARFQPRMDSLIAHPCKLSERIPFHTRSDAVGPTHAG